jgi:hypothetical protein
MTLRLSSSSKGNLDISWSGIKTYLNAGKGTEEATKVKSVSIELGDTGNQNTDKEINFKDDKNLEENKFLSGFNVNKNVRILLLIVKHKTHMKKFLIQYKMPLAGLDAWMAKPESERKPVEEDLMKKWQEWTMAHKEWIVETSGAGKTKKVDKGGVSDFRNEIMLFSIVQGEDKDKVVELFKNHPHLEIPEAWIEVTDMNPMG